MKIKNNLFLHCGKLEINIKQLHINIYTVSIYHLYRHTNLRRRTRS